MSTMRVPANTPLVSLPQDPAQIREKAEKAARRIRELCNYKEMVEGYLELYRSVK